MKIVWYTNKLGRIYVDNMLVGLAHKHNDGSVTLD
jgi:hypothetical protein